MMELLPTHRSQIRTKGTEDMDPQAASESRLEAMEEFSYQSAKP